MFIFMEEYRFTVETTHISSYHVQYSEANLKWGLQVRVKDPQRAPEYLCLSENKTEVDTVYQKLNEKISVHRPFGARG